MSASNQNLRGAGLGEILPSSQGRAMTKDRSLADQDDGMQRAAVQYVEQPVAAAPKTAAPAAADDPFGIFGAPAAPAPAPTSVFDFQSAPVTQSHRTAPPAKVAASEDPFAMFAPTTTHAPAPAPAPAADDPFAGFAPTKPVAAPVAAAAPAPAPGGWGFGDDDDFFNFSSDAKPAGGVSGSAPSTGASTTAASEDTPDLAALNIKDKPPPLPTEGAILARLSARSLFAKDWTEAYWVFRGYHLYIYRCLDDFKYGKQGENIKKEITINAKMRCLPIKKKDYSGHGQLHNFFLEEVEDYGANQICKFASGELKDLDILYTQINRRIRKLKGV